MASLQAALRSQMLTEGRRALEHGGSWLSRFEQASGAQHRRRPVRDILYRDV